MSNLSDMQMMEFTAEKVWLYVSQRVLADMPGLRSNLKLHEHIEQNIREMVLTLSGWCVAGRIPSREERVTIEYPDGAWQMLKYEYAPWWFKQRFPVRMHKREVTVTTHHYFVCPHLVTEPQGTHVKFMATGSPIASRMR